MKVKVIEENCIGCGACQALVPKVFEIDDDDNLAKVISNPIDKELEDDVVDAAEGCPTGAITVREDD